MAVLVLPSWIYGNFFYQTRYKKQNADESHREINQELEEYINFTKDSIRVERKKTLSAFENELKQNH